MSDSNENVELPTPALGEAEDASASAPETASAAGEGGAPATVAEGELDADAVARYKAILDKYLKEECSAEEQEYTATLQAALDEAGIEVPPQQMYMPLAFVRGFIYDTYKDKPNKVEMTIVELKEAIEFRKTIQTKFPLLETPEVRSGFEKYMHSYIPEEGGDFEGYPLWILDLPARDFTEQLPKEQIMAYHARDFMTLEMLKMRASLRHGRKISGHVVVADMSHSDGGLSGALGVAKKMNAILEVPVPEGAPEGTKPKNMDSFYFPESMQSSLILNAPWWFQGLWKVASLFLEPTTRAKVKVLGADYADVLFKRGCLGFLPRYLGGCSPNPTALSMKEYGEGVDVIGRPGKDGAVGSPLEYFVKSGSGAEKVYVCFPRTHRVEWEVSVAARNLVLHVTGVLRRAGRNDSIVVCDGTKFNEGAKHVGSFDRTGGHGGAGGGATKAGGRIEGEDDVSHGFVIFNFAGSSGFRSTTVHLSVKLVEA